MTDLFDYLTWRGDLSIKDYDFNEVDGTILSRLSYVPFTDVVPKDLHSSVMLKYALDDICSLPDIEKNLLLADDLRLMHAVSKSERFNQIYVCGFVNQIDEISQTQFSAIIFRLKDGLYFVAFRGTDATLVGWKEDFNMSFTIPVPAQKAATEYFDQAASTFFNSSFILGGHSKGGNLAVYAAAFCSPKSQEKIISVYNFDGPGFDSNTIQTKEYAKISNKITTIVPQSSVVGMLLEHEENYTVIHSRQVGIYQHDVYSWEILKDHFIPLDDVTNSSKLLDKALKEIISQMSIKQREQFVDVIFRILSETNAHTLNELSSNWFESAKAVLKSISNLDDSTKKVISETLKLFLHSTKRNAIQAINKKS